MYPGLKFSLEIVDGDRLGKLAVPYSQVADWLNFLTSPHYGIQIIYSEQKSSGITIYFEACEGLYSYLQNKINAESRSVHQEATLAVAV